MTFLRTPLCLALLAATPLVWAGRPLASDDAGTADTGTCQVETWSERAGSDRAFVLAPACGIAPGVEIGADHAWLSPRDVVRAEAGLAVKWVPAALKFGTPAGELNLGFKLGAAWVQPAGASWQRTEVGGLVLATLQASDAVTVHTNLGLSRDRASRTQATVLNLALVWEPVDAVQLFAEAQGNNKREVFGGTVSSVGGRYWLIKDTLGLDLTASRESGAGGPTRWTIGLGWYGIGS